MSIEHSESPEFNELSTINFLADEDYIGAAEYYAETLDVSIEDFLEEAINFDLLLRAIKNTGAILEADYNDCDISERIPFVTLSKHYDFGIENDDVDPDEERRFIELSFSEFQWLELMLDAMNYYGKDVEDVKREFQTWEQQRNKVGFVLYSAIHNYVIRLDAECAGWQMYINSNLGYDNRQALERRQDNE